MYWNKKDFPENTIPIHIFSVDEKGNLIHKTEHRYATVTNGRRKTYRIYTEYGIKTRDYDQIDICKNNCLYTFNSDPDNALRIIRRYYQEKKEAAQKAYLDASARLELIAAANKLTDQFSETNSEN